MAQKRIQRARITRKKEHPFDRFLYLGIGKWKQIDELYKREESLFLVLLWLENKFRKNLNLFDEMKKVIEYDQKVGNKQRIELWLQLKEKDMSQSEILRWAHSQFSVEVDRLIKEVKELDCKEQHKRKVGIQYEY